MCLLSQCRRGWEKCATRVEDMEQGWGSPQASLFQKMLDRAWMTSLALLSTKPTCEQGRGPCEIWIHNESTGHGCRASWGLARANSNTGTSAVCSRSWSLGRASDCFLFFWVQGNGLLTLELEPLSWPLKHLTEVVSSRVKCQSSRISTFHLIPVIQPCYTAQRIFITNPHRHFRTSSPGAFRNLQMRQNTLPFSPIHFLTMHTRLVSSLNCNYKSFHLYQSWKQYMVKAFRQPQW
jgi:hypothetical protein